MQSHASRCGPGISLPGFGPCHVGRYYLSRQVHSHLYLLGVFLLLVSSLKGINMQKKGGYLTCRLM